MYVDPEGLSAIPPGGGIMAWLRPHVKLGNGRAAVPRPGETAAQFARRQAAINNLQRLSQKTEMKQLPKQPGLKPDNMGALGRLLKNLDEFSDFLGIPVTTGVGSSTNSCSPNDSRKELEKAFDECVATGGCI